MLLSIDPGLNNCGLAVINTDNQFTVIETATIKNARKFDTEEKTLENFFNTRIVKLLHIEKSIRGFLEKYSDISEVAIEAPFYHASTPMAFSSLLEVVSVIKHKIFIPIQINPKMVEPMLVKKMFITEKLTKGMNGKEVMKEFLKKRIAIGDVVYAGDVEVLSEHEIDAIGVGFTHKLMEKLS
ncbi:hypothetical protein [Flavobacterium sp.]|jgi:Holliday junction resolvasome RuvABC endonuclease subunit|uniref:hypothetical protein n=1 Tax=Flavobacterium sp. TaxID=239 RepID=UPI0037BFB0B9